MWSQLSTGRSTTMKNLHIMEMNDRPLSMIHLHDKSYITDNTLSLRWNDIIKENDKQSTRQKVSNLLFVD